MSREYYIVLSFKDLFLIKGNHLVFQRLYENTSTLHNWDDESENEFICFTAYYSGNFDEILPNHKDNVFTLMFTKERTPSLPIYSLAFRDLNRNQDTYTPTLVEELPSTPFFSSNKFIIAENDIRKSLLVAAAQFWSKRIVEITEVNICFVAFRKHTPNPKPAAVSLTT